MSKSINEIFDEVSNKKLKNHEKADLLGQALREGVKNTLDSKEFANWCKAQSRLFFNRYSFNNCMLTYLQKPDATFVNGYEGWKEYGRQVKEGAKSIKIIAPVYAKEFRGPGSLFNLIKKECKKQFENNKNVEFASYRLGKGKMSFNMYKNGLWDVKYDGKTIRPHITDDEMKSFIKTGVIGKIPTYYTAVSVFDIKDTTDKIEELWVSPGTFSRDEMVLDENGSPIINNKGKYKIKNSDERRAIINNYNNIEVIKENEPEKMELLYDVLKKISADKGVPLTECSPEKDQVLKNGALGYFSREQKKIVISEDLSLTNKVSVAFHEIAHSDLHQDLKMLKDKMELDAGEKITREIKEIQAEATAYIAGSAFGIETEHKSFEYIAKWSNGRELEELEKSLNVIFEEGDAMLKSIENELIDRGYSMNLEKLKNEPDNEVEKNEFISKYSDLYFEKSEFNKDYLNEVKKEMEKPRNVAIKCMIREQISTVNKIDNMLLSINNKLHEYEKTDDKDLQSSIKDEIVADFNKIDLLYNDLEDIAKEKINIITEVAKNSNNLHDMFESSPMKAYKELDKLYTEIRELTPVELKYVAASEYIADNYAGFLDNDIDKFVKLVSDRAKEFTKALSKNNTVVEIKLSEHWGDEPVIQNGMIAHPKAINKIVAEKEKNIRKLKKEAEKKDEYFPYSKCVFNIYHVDGKNSLSRAVTRIDIGDGEQKDLVEHLEKISKNSKLVQDFEKSVRERKDPYVHIPEPISEIGNDNIISAEENNLCVAENTTETMEFWKNEVKNENISSEQKESQVIDKSNLKEYES